MDNDRLRTWTILALSFIRLILILLVIYLSLVYIRNILFRPRIGCSSSALYITSRDADEITGTALRSLVAENILDSNYAIYSFEHPKGKTVQAWRYTNGMFVEVDIDTLQVAPFGYRIFILSLRQNEARVCVESMGRGFERGSGGNIYIWTLERESGEWKIISKISEFSDYGMQPLPK